MNTNRVKAIEKIANYKEGYSDGETSLPKEEYGKYVFNEKMIKKFLPKESAEKLLATIREQKPLDPTIADDVANAMKEWAIGLGATHYTHWFQPLSGGTAEKHDAFLEISDSGEPLKVFSGKKLIKGEPDASSFPSGGLRCTFEARGYTAWDPTSPAFVKPHRNGMTLCIPTIFCSYNGEILDKKTPVLRSIKALEKAVRRLMALFGNDTESPVKVSLGAEQEYFLIDRNFFLNRPDLVQTGRTLFGSAPPRNKQLADHYFGSIRPEILAFMTDVDHELWRLGIPAKTRHNETAPAQFEIAPIFEELNIAIDHNMLMMDILKRTAVKHGMVCLLHEKPFAGVNGSGKHNNWSVTYKGHNLLNPGSNPEQNAVFLTVLAAIIRAVDLHSDILRASTVSAGNKYRLGMGEAPPVIISISLGETLTGILDRLGSSEEVASKPAEMMRIGVDTLPPLPRDNTDRNRTSPFAFTGNKFEFRACGSGQSCAGFNTVMNTIIAESIDVVAERLEKLDRSDKEAFHSGLTAVIAEIIRKHRRIIFNGNNYSPEWAEEAQRRGLPNVRKTIDALRAYIKPENVDLFSRYGVFSKAELISRFEVFRNDYHSRVRIEGGVALEMARTMILPTVTRQYRETLQTLQAAQETKTKRGKTAAENMATIYGDLLDQLAEGCDALEKALGGEHEGIIDNMKRLREIVDHAEDIIDDSLWPLPKYREMLFVYN